MRRLALSLPLMVLLLAVAGCGPTYPKCNSDKDCKEKNEFCVNGMCQQCRNDKDCKAGEACNKGRCEPTAKSCSADGDCPGDQSCINSTCKPCASDDQCGEGGKCSRGRCQRPSALPTGPTGPTTPARCGLDSIYFDFNESVLTTEATSTIEQDAECIKGTPGRAVTLTGRTDPRGTEEYNLALSEKRAQSVKERLERVGVDGGRLRTVARGELDSTGNDESGWAKDRRVDLLW